MEAARAIPVVGYDALSAEYYDAARHPTCANFREGSELLLRRWLDPLELQAASVCEVGAGASLTAELMDEWDLPLGPVLATDDSPAMLAHSERWRGHGIRLAVAGADAQPCPAEAMDVVIASLGDPYNDTPFWREVGRILAPAGRAIFTTPSYAWARALRRTDPPDPWAIFETSDGDLVRVPSTILTADDQSALISGAGLTVLDRRSIRQSQLSSPLSPKLEVLSPEDPVVTGYVVERK